ncbi:MAG: biopolymer transporter ExbD [Planctomycetaceae bacterium]
MRVPSTYRQRGLKFNITPMIDIVFLLVIFFLVSTHFVNSEHREDLALPTATQSDDRPTTPRRLVINLLSDGEMRVNGRTVDLPAVVQMLQQDAAEGIDDYEVQIRGDREVTYNHVEPILLACARHGITRVGFKKLDESLQGHSRAP